jgi:hypothetical protein
MSCEEVEPQKPIREGIIRTWKVDEVQIGIGIVDLTTVYKSGDPVWVVNYDAYRLTLFENNDYFKIDEYGFEHEGIWEFASDDTKILFDKGIDIKDIANILEYSTGNLVLQFLDEDTKFGTINRIFYFIPADN